MITQALKPSTLSLLGLILLIFTISAGALPIGVCYGLNGNNLPSKQDAINLYKEKGITKMRIYSPVPEVLNALRGSNIELLVDVSFEDIKPLATDASVAPIWIHNNIQTYWPDVKFRYIAVGNEVNPESEYAPFIGPAIENLHNAIVAAGLQDQIKVSTSTYPPLLGASNPPSQGSFSDVAKPFIKPIIDLLVGHNAPLLVNIYPYFTYLGNQGNGELDYALFRSPGVVVQDGSLGYENLYDAMLDAFYWALEKEGGNTVEIVVSETGWPSEGSSASSVENAGTYYKNLINHVKGGSGTPRRPGKAIETYLFAMFDENEKTGDETEKHFGLFTPNKQPKYAVSFT
ncbi:glucan endo-1,3-beta-glucosidase-like [Coffea arabica]|uniref:Glucan endo-1,3-beta-glucosidase-like n=1 Tax=Coffea arabica TaxID=13443 RepID=A0ABM4U1I2_COFAR